MNVRTEIVMPGDLRAHLGGLTEILHLSVNGDGAIGFILPFSTADSETFWRRTVFPIVRQGKRILLIGCVDDQVAGTVQLHIDLPANQPHRCEVAKLMVHPSHRQKGIAKALMLALEAEAQKRGKKLITLDTRAGDNAAPLYTTLGYLDAGAIPNFALNPDGADFHATTYMYKEL